MKKLFTTAITFISLVISAQVFADCYEAGEFVCCEGRSCAVQMTSSRYVSECQCTDPNVIRNNPCLTVPEYCRAFGNVGADTRIW